MIRLVLDGPVTVPPERFNTSPPIVTAAVPLGRLRSGPPRLNVLPDDTVTRLLLVVSDVVPVAWISGPASVAEAALRATP